MFCNCQKNPDLDGPRRASRGPIPLMEMLEQKAPKRPIIKCQFEGCQANTREGKPYSNPSCAIPMSIICSFYNESVAQLVEHSAQAFNSALS